MDPETTPCVPVETDDCDDDGHHYYHVDIITAHYTRANAQITRVHRVLLYCTRCGHTRFVNDDDAPEMT